MTQALWAVYPGCCERPQEKYLSGVGDLEAGFLERVNIDTET